MRLPTVCFRHVLVLSGCQFNASVSLFSRLRRFFQAIYARFLCSLPVLHCARSRSGGVRCVAFYKHDLAFVPFSFFHPLHVGEQSVEYPQGVISIPTYKSRWLFTATYTSLTYNLIVRGLFISFLFVLGCLCLAHSASTKARQSLPLASV